MKHYELVGPKVVKLREERGLSQADLARAIGVTRASMSQFESGGRQPSSATTLKIAHVLKVKFAAITRTKGYEGEEAETAKARAAFAAEQAAS